MKQGTVSVTAQKKTYADILHKDASHQDQKTPWIMIQSKTKPLAQELALKRLPSPAKHES